MLRTLANLLLVHQTTAMDRGGEVRLMAAAATPSAWREELVLNFLIASIVALFPELSSSPDMSVRCCALVDLCQICCQSHLPRISLLSYALGSTCTCVVRAKILQNFSVSGFLFYDSVLFGSML